MSVLRRTLYLLSTICAAVLCAVLYGQGQPPPEKYGMLHLSKCAPPCWNGINPGITPMEEGKRLLKETFEHSDYAQINETNGDFSLSLYHSETGFPCVVVSLELTPVSSTVVGYILFQFFPASGCNSYNLSVVLIMLGTPDYIIEDFGSFTPQLPVIAYKKTASTDIYVQFNYYPPNKGTLVDVIDFHSGEVLDANAVIQTWRGISPFNR